MTSEELLQIANTVHAETAKFDFEVNVCMGTGCISQHSDKLKAALSKEASANTDAGKRCHVRRTAVWACAPRAAGSGRAGECDAR